MIGHEAVDLTCTDQLALDFGGVEFTTGDELMEVEACEVQRAVATAIDRATECVDFRSQGSLRVSTAAD